MFSRIKIDREKPVVIAGPTASGKSALALELARAHDGVVINADALQVYDCWQVLSARPSQREMDGIAHFLYGHVARQTAYSVGAWLRDLRAVLGAQAGRLPIIVGGTGLYLSALVTGLADIPPTPDAVRAQAMRRLRQAGGLRALLAEIDSDTRARIDCQNPARVARAWEVQTATGRGLAAWQDATPAPLLPRRDINALVIAAPKEWLTPRINSRFRQMIENGALDEARAALATWNPELPSARAIGAAELIAHLRGETDLETAIARAEIATRQYAKRQRSWFRARMGDWQWVDLSTGRCE